jgi:hypothetical protein
VSRDGNRTSTSPLPPQRAVPSASHAAAPCRRIITTTSEPPNTQSFRLSLPRRCSCLKLFFVPPCITVAGRPRPRSLPHLRPWRAPAPSHHPTASLRPPPWPSARSSNCCTTPPILDSSGHLLADSSHVLATRSRVQLVVANCSQPWLASCESQLAKGGHSKPQPAKACCSWPQLARTHRSKPRHLHCQGQPFSNPIDAILNVDIALAFHFIHTCHLCLFIHDLSISMLVSCLHANLYIVLWICATPSVAVCVVGSLCVCVVCLWTEPSSRSRDRTSFKRFGHGIHLVVAVKPIVT